MGTPPTGERGLRDEYGLKGLGGCYCFMPYEKMDDKNKCLFKVGMTIDFISRIEEYHTYFPEDVYCVAFLVDPVVPEWDHNRKKEWIQKRKINKLNTNFTLLKAMKTDYYKKIESYIFSELNKSPNASRLYSTTRVKNPDLVTNKGETEWVYTNCSTIHNAFQLADIKFPGGELMKFYFSGIDTITGKIIKSINDTHNTKRNKFSSYTGSIVHSISNNIS